MSSFSVWLKNRLTVQLLWIFWSLMLFIGFLCSKFLITLALIFPFVWALIERFRKTPLEKNNFRQPVYWALTGTYLLMLFGSIWNANDTTELITRLRVNLAFLTLPIAWALLPRIEMKTIQIIIKGFLYCLIVGLIWTFVNYALDYEAINESLERSKAIPVPHKDHIRFSLMVCLAAYMALWLGKQENKKVYYFLAICFAISLHILAVRSGLLAFYLTLLVVVLVYFFKQGKYLIGSMALVVLFMLPYLAYLNLESFRNKVALTIHNIELMQEGYVGEYSDTRRLLSYKIGWEVYKTAPFLGIGIGNIQPEVFKIYEKNYPEQSPIMPHNQYLSYLIGLGAIGLFIFLALSAWVFCYKSSYKSFLVLIFYIIFFSSFLTENTLFISVGSNLYVYFLLLFVNVAAIQRADALEKRNEIL